MAFDLAPIAGYQTLTGLVKAFFDQSRNRMLQSMFFGKKKNILGEYAKFHTIRASRGLAPIVGRRDTAVEQNLLGLEEREVAPLNILVSKTLYATDVLQGGWPTPGREGPGLQLLPNAAQRVADEVQDLVNMVPATLEWAAGKLLFTGTIPISAANVPGSKFTKTITFDNTQTLNGGSAFWSTSSSKLVTDTHSGALDRASFPAIKHKMRSVAGLEASRILVNFLQTAELQANTEIQNIFRGSVPGAPVMPASIDAINTVTKAQGLNLEFMEYNAGYVPSGGAFTRFVPDGYYCALPDTNEFFEMHEGYGEIPVGPIVGAVGTPSAAGGLDLIKLSSPGIWSYAVLNPKPPLSWELFVGYRGLPVVTFGESIIHGTTSA